MAEKWIQKAIRKPGSLRKVVYKRVGKKLVKKGSSKSVAKAKAYMRALHAHSKD